MSFSATFLRSSTSRGISFKTDKFKPEGDRIDALRKGKRSTDLITDSDVANIVDDSENTNPLSQYVDKERRRLVIHALESIPKAQRMAVYLAYYGGFSHRQIAERLGEPLGTIKTRIQLGLYKLRQALEPYFST